MAFAARIFTRLPRVQQQMTGISGLVNTRFLSGASPGSMHNKHVLSTWQFGREEIENVVQMAGYIHAARTEASPTYTSDLRQIQSVLSGRLLGTMIFDEFDAVAFSAAMQQLGGSVVDLDPKGRSTTKNIEARVISMNDYVDGIALSHPEPGTIDRAAYVSRVPIINSGKAGGDPAQALTAIFTIVEELGLDSLDGLTVTVVGDLANDARALSLCNMLANFNNVTINIVTPPELDTSKLKILDDDSRLLMRIDAHLASRRERLIDFFHDLDTDESGGVDYNELTLGLRSRGIETTADEEKQIMKILDPNSDGEVEYHEMVTAWKSMIAANTSTASLASDANYNMFETYDDLLSNTDVLYFTPVPGTCFYDKNEHSEYMSKYKLTSKKLAHAKEDMVVMKTSHKHNEVARDVDSDSRAAYTKQSGYALSTRMALLSLACGSPQQVDFAKTISQHHTLSIRDQQPMRKRGQIREVDTTPKKEKYENFLGTSGHNNRDALAARPMSRKTVHSL